jgi:hypothetical protein
MRLALHPVLRWRFTRGYGLGRANALGRGSHQGHQTRKWRCCPSITMKILSTTFRKFQGSLKETDLTPRVALRFTRGYGNWSS